MKARTFSFNIFGILAFALMAAAMFYPWWSFHLESAGRSDIYPYRLDGPARELVGYRRSPQMELLTYVLGTGIGLAFVGTFVKGRLGRGMLALSGILALAGAGRLVMRLSGVAARFHIPLEGSGYATYEGIEFIPVQTWLSPGFYIMLAGAALVLLGAITNFRLRIT